MQNRDLLNKQKDTLPLYDKVSFLTTLFADLKVENPWDAFKFLGRILRKQCCRSI